ncbi:alpha/beta fold hydrolase [Saccharopolyspora sp. NPDC050642]|uniref:alpha/beta fold hydrolase n=1 Tax=Saccharopolyspora sp. NPDC050642 TaxID=3157099 RepID=UPI0033D1BF43
MIRTKVSDVDFVVAGSGTPLVLLHGIGGAADAFDAQLSGLAGDHRVIAWDAPGYGGSADLPGEPDLDAYADAVVSALRGLDAEPAHLLGVSWGGVIATRVAIKAPEVLRSLILADSSRGSGRTADGRKAMAARVRELTSHGADAFAAARGPRLVAPGADPAVRERVVALMSRVRPRGYRNAARVMAATDHSAQLAVITTPTLVVVGAEDAVTGVAESRVLAEEIPHARLVEIPGAGHAANQERPAEFNAAVRAFLAELDTRGGVL